MSISKIAIVIVTYNGMRWLDKCLKSTDNYFTVVVDNASKDNTVSFIESNFPKCHVIKNLENRGFGQANNQGIALALEKGATSVFLLNQDAYLYPDTLKKLENASKNHKEFGILSPLHLDGTEKVLDRNFANYIQFSKNPRFFSDACLGKLKEIYEVPFVNAAGWFLTKECLLSVGGFDPMFFHYAEDDNYCQRCLFHNFSIGILSSAIFIHDRANRDAGIKQKVTRARRLLYEERGLKLKWGNLNVEFAQRDQLNMRIRRLKSIVKMLLNLKWNDTIFHLICLYKFDHKWIREIVESRKINENKGAHYIKWSIN